MGLWRRLVSVIVLSVFSGLPVGATLCAALCTPFPGGEVKAAAHHGEHGSHAQHTSPEAQHTSLHAQHASPFASQETVDTRLVMGGAPSHHACPGHVTAGSAALLPGVRADAGLIPVVQQVMAASPYLFRPAPLRAGAGAGPSPPPGATSPTRAPLVLRI